jgi:hypothetical protein
MTSTTIAQHAARHNDFKGRLADASKRLLESQASLAESQANALLDGKAFDAGPGSAEIARCQAEVNALRVAVDKTGTALEDARAAEKRDRISTATEAWSQAVQARDTDIARSMAALAAALEHLQVQGVPAAALARWIDVHGPKFLHHSINSNSVPNGIGRLQGAHDELTQALGQGAGRGISEALQAALPIPDRAAIDEMSEAMLPLVIAD